MISKEQTAKLEHLVIETVKTENPKTTEQLIDLMSQRYSLSPDETKKILVELENANRLQFSRLEFETSKSIKGYILSQRATWFWATTIIAVLSTMATFTIPVDSLPFVYFRNVAGIIFTFVVSGYAFIKMLFPHNLPIRNGINNIDHIERIILSISASIAINPIMGLALTFTPWGINQTSITISLLALTIIFTAMAVLRDFRYISGNSDRGLINGSNR